MRLSLVLAGFALLASPALAQNAPPARIRGTIQQVMDHQFMVKAQDGHSYTIVVGPKSRVVADNPQTVNGIQPGMHLATDLVKGPDGHYRATVGHTQPKPFGNNALWFHPIAGKPGAMRLLGIVKSVMPTKDGAMVTVSYDKGDMDIEIPSSILLYDVSFDGPGLLKPNLAVTVSYDRAADGTLTGRFVTVEKNGFKPVN